MGNTLLVLVIDTRRHRGHDELEEHILIRGVDLGRAHPEERGARGIWFCPNNPVSYTHLTLPTIYSV